MVKKQEISEYPIDTAVLDWLLAGDVAIEYQTRRDLMADEHPHLRSQIAKTGWGRDFLEQRLENGSWGKGFYQPKWTCTHYTLLQLKALQIDPQQAEIRATIDDLLAHNIAKDGGVDAHADTKHSDACITGMFLNYASYFGAAEQGLQLIIDYLMAMQMPDGGFNCMKNRSGATHSSLHTTLSVLEGLLAYKNAGHTYLLDETERLAEQARSFILLHRFYLSDRTGEVIHKDFLRMPYPPYWRYNILRALDYFQSAEIPYHPAMADALGVIIDKAGADGRWPRQAAHPGKVFFVMEKPRGPSRWNTLLALRVLRAYGQAGGVG